MHTSLPTLHDALSIARNALAPQDAKGKPSPGPRGLIAHATWLPGGDTLRPYLAIWAETETTLFRRRSRTTVTDPSASALGRHPFGAKRTELYELLERLWKLSRPSVRPRTSYEEDRLDIWLPSCGKRPLPSPELCRAGWAPGAMGNSDAAAEPSEEVTPHLALWRINALLLEAEAAVTLLFGLPHTPEQMDLAAPYLCGAQDGQRSLALGSDLRFWAGAAAVLLDLLARQQFVPGVRVQESLPTRNVWGSYFGGHGGGMYSAWYPALNVPQVRERLDVLIETMPPLCRAVEELPGSEAASEPRPDTAPSPRALLLDFAQHGTQAMIGHWLTKNFAPLTLPGEVRQTRTNTSPFAAFDYFGQRRSLAASWLAGLPYPNAQLGIYGQEQRQALQMGLERWHTGMRSFEHDTFRLCFRLLPPEALDPNQDVDESDAPQGEMATDGETRTSSARDGTGQNAAWRLDYLLQARDDPSLLLPLDVVWQEHGATARFLDRRFDHPHKRVLAGLAEAGQVFAPIARSLEDSRPTGCALSGEEAYQFLTEALPRFESADVGVQVPSWWARKEIAKPQLKLNLRERRQEGSGLFGVDTLVAFDWQVALGGVDLAPDELERLVTLKEPLVRLRGQWVEVRQEDMSALLRYVRSHGKRQESLGEAFRAALTGRTDDDEFEIAEVRANGWIGDLLGRLREGDTPTPIEPPTGLHGTLRPYQQRGLNWLAFLARYGLGACLADDMGLGKTISFLALVQHLKEAGELRGPVLIVCPTSVVGNWRREAERFTPDLRVLIHHGAERTVRKDAKRLPEEVARHDLVITTYSLLPRDVEALGKLAWNIVALDEAQNIKNADTKQSRAARKLFAPIRVALTGTPVENRLDELWSVMDFLNPGYLGSRQRFNERFAWTIEKEHDAEATEQLRALVRPFILRRLKTDPEIISDLPKKIEMREYCTLTREQVTLYQAVVRDGLRQLEEADDPMSRRGLIFKMLTRLKQVCNHPAHFLGDGSAFAGRSGKLIRLEELLEEMLEEGDRALIFTQFTALGERLQQHLRERFGVDVAYLHGGVPRTQRDRLVERFQSEGGPPIFVLSLKAGGTGLNLTRANQVVHFDRWWNPAVENQATDRAFRIGQTRNVQVRKFVCSGTLEDRIDQLIEQKRGLAEQVIGSGEGWLTELSTAELRDVLRLRVEAVS